MRAVWIIFPSPLLFGDWSRAPSRDVDRPPFFAGASLAGKRDDIRRVGAAIGKGAIKIMNLKSVCSMTGLVLTAISSTAAYAADGSFVFRNDSDYDVSISLDNEPRCTLAAHGSSSCTISFDGSSAHTFYYTRPGGAHASSTYTPGMATFEDCSLLNSPSNVCKASRPPF